MSTLEELKKQAQQAKQQEEDQTQSSAMAEQKKWKKMAPVMKYLLSHFKELAETLNILNNDLLVNFEINDDITLMNLKSQNFQIVHPNEDKEREFIFEFENKGEFPQYCKIQTGPLADSLSKLLKENNVGYSRKPIENNKFFKFEINSYVRTKYHFIADIENERVMLNIINYDGLWKQKNNFNKEQITQELVDALTNHAMRKDNKYDEITGNVVSEEMKTQLREKLQKEAAKNKQQEAAMTEQDEPKKEKTLLGRFFKK